MRLLPFALLILWGIQDTLARLTDSLPVDTYAFPKYRVTYLNGLPVLKDTADRWLQEGLRGGEPEFLEQPWSEDAPPPFKGIGSGQEADHSLARRTPNVTLEHIRMGPEHAYVCLVPPVPEVSEGVDELEEEDASPAQSWSLLQPLNGRCLYHRSTWFTYSYCHNQEIRQFRELAHTQPHAGAAFEPEEDPEWESFTLGRAPPTGEPGVDLTLAQENQVAANLELAKGAGSRYLVQRWGDGTPCDKNGQPREVEVQFHCSMTMTDHILLVREAKTCSYVLVVNTPRLCNQPGFKSHLESREEAFIRCREIVDTPEAAAQADGPLTESDIPAHQIQPSKPLLGTPDHLPLDNKKASEGTGKLPGYNDRIRKTLEAILGGKGGGDYEPLVVEQVDLGNDDEALLFEIELDEYDLEGDEDGGLHPSLMEALRAAGFDVKGEKSEDKQKKKKGKEADTRRDEL